MEEGLGARDVGNEGADAVSVDADGGLFGTDDVGEVDAVGLEECFAEKWPRISRPTYLR